MNIIAQLQGGLGNQLFQYATARSLSIVKKTPLLLDCTWYQQTYDDVTPRELLIRELKTAGAVISLEQTTQKPKRIRRLLQKIWPLSPYIFYEASAYRFDRRVFMAPSFTRQDLYLMGYWQSYKYFEAIKSTLAAELTPQKALSSHYLTYLEKIQGVQSAMVHIRRGDYVILNSANKVHGTLSIDYYRNGMEKLLERDRETHFFIFSDDLAWAKQNLPATKQITFIESIDTANAVIQELELMKYCKSYLIANSSLSWWGAWLSNNKNAFVICPKNWTQDLNMNWDDLIPANWISL